MFAEKENRCRIGAGSTVEERKLGIDVRRKVMRGTDTGGVVLCLLLWDEWG